MSDEPASDGRVLLVAGDAALAGAGDLVLRAAPRVGATPPHGLGCRCCRPPDALADALNRLYLEWMRANAAPPRRVLVEASPATLAATLAGNVLLRARFRVAEFAPKA